MRLIVALILLLSVGGGALIYYQCTNKSQRKTEVEQNQSSDGTLPAAIHQPQTKNEAASAYDPASDCLYRLYLVATIVGVFAALGGIYVIYSQTEATQEAARAAFLNAKAVIDSERPWMFQGIRYANMITDKPGYGEQFGLTKVVYVFRNYGRTPARVTNIRLRFHTCKSISELGVSPDWNPNTQFSRYGAKGATVPPGGRLKDEVRFEGSTWISQADMRDMEKGALILCTYGRIDYLDTLTNAPHYSQFCYFYDLPPFDPRTGYERQEGWQINGPPRYNEAD